MRQTLRIRRVLVLSPSRSFCVRSKPYLQRRPGFPVSFPFQSRHERSSTHLPDVMSSIPTRIIIPPSRAIRARLPSLLARSLQVPTPSQVLASARFRRPLPRVRIRSSWIQGTVLPAPPTAFHAPPKPPMRRLQRASVREASCGSRRQLPMAVVVDRIRRLWFRIRFRRKVRSGSKGRFGRVRKGNARHEPMGEVRGGKKGSEMPEVRREYRLPFGGRLGEVYEATTGIVQGEPMGGDTCTRRMN